MSLSKLLRAQSEGFSLALGYQRMMITAGQVMWHRGLQMLTGTMRADEFQKMWWEKQLAGTKAIEKSATAAVRGESVTQIMQAGMKPILRKTTANARRLSD